MYLMATILDSAFAQALSPDPQASALFNTHYLASSLICTIDISNLRCLKS